MLVKITSGPGVGQVVDLVPAVAQARIAGGTAVAVPRPMATRADGARSAAAPQHLDDVETQMRSGAPRRAVSRAQTKNARGS